MQAETAYNVIEALSSREKNRLFKMLGLKRQEPEKKTTQPLLSDAEAKEYLLKKLKRS